LDSSPWTMATRCSLCRQRVGPLYRRFGYRADVLPQDGRAYAAHLQLHLCFEEMSLLPAASENGWLSASTNTSGRPLLYTRKWNASPPTGEAIPTTCPASGFLTATLTATPTTFGERWRTTANY